MSDDENRQYKKKHHSKGNYPKKNVLVPVYPQPMYQMMPQGQYHMVQPISNATPKTMMVPIGPPITMAQPIGQPVMMAQPVVTPQPILTPQPIIAPQPVVATPMTKPVKKQKEKKKPPIVIIKKYYYKEEDDCCVVF